MAFRRPVGRQEISRLKLCLLLFGLEWPNGRSFRPEALNYALHKPHKVIIVMPSFLFNIMQNFYVISISRSGPRSSENLQHHGLAHALRDLLRFLKGLRLLKERGFPRDVRHLRWCFRDIRCLSEFLTELRGCATCHKDEGKYGKVPGHPRFLSDVGKSSNTCQSVLLP